MAFQNLIRWFLPKEDKFYTLLELQGKVLHEGALALSQLGAPVLDGPAVRDRVQDLEHQGDKVMHEVEESLAKTFVTPIDREDIQRLSAELDDILDITNRTARAFVLYGVTKPSEPMIRLFELFVKATKILKDAVPSLRNHAYDALRDATREVKQIEKQADGIFRQAVSELFNNPAIDAKAVLREKELLEDLESAIDHCEDVAEFLTNLAVKHG
jgi:uncharacterized protein